MNREALKIHEVDDKPRPLVGIPTLRSSKAQRELAALEEE